MITSTIAGGFLKAIISNVGKLLYSKALIQLNQRLLEKVRIRLTEALGRLSLSHGRCEQVLIAGRDGSN